MSNWKLSERFNYRFGRYISQGTKSFAIVLLVITLISVFISTILLTFVRSGSTLVENIRDAIIYTLSPSNLLAGKFTGPGDFVALLIVAICGLLVTSTLVALIVTVVQGKLESLSKGHSKVAEDGHTVILGFNDNTYTIINELIAANDLDEKCCTVVGADFDKIGMQEEIKSHTDPHGNMHVVSRSGAITDPLLYDRCSLETCKTIIMAENDDNIVIKTVLGVVNYLEDHDAMDPKRRICVLVNSADNFQAALLAGKGAVDLLYIEDNIAHILSQTCHQPGISRVYSDLFNFHGDEIHFDEIPALVGRSFGDILPMFAKGVALGICRGEDTMLAPEPELLIQEGDRIILYEDTALGQTANLDARLPEKEPIAANPQRGVAVSQLLILGCNEMLPGILDSLSRYLTETVKVTVCTRHDTAFVEKETYERLDLKIIHADPLNRYVLEDALRDEYDHVLTLSDYTQDAEAADSRTLLQLIHLRDINEQRARRFQITSEIRTPGNEQLARVSDARDFVVGTRIISVMLVQLAKNHLAWKIFHELLDPTGTEISIAPAGDYLSCGEEIDFYDVTAAAAHYHDIALGYEKVDERGNLSVVVNPVKSEKLTLTERDALIVLSRSSSR